MKNKLIRSVVGITLSLGILLASLYVPAIKGSKWGEFWFSFSITLGSGAFLAAIYQLVMLRKERHIAA